jgi:small subunit ribosomal protein S6
VTEEERTAVVDRTKEIITSGKGVIVKIDEWGKKRLAFEIKDSQDGFYYIMYFEATAETLAEVTRVLGITDPVLRFMPIRHEKAFGALAPAKSAKVPAAEEAEE